MKFQVYRTHASSYQDSKYLANEKKILEDISDVEYIQTLQQYEAGSKLILLTNTHTNTELIPRRILQETVLLVHPNSGHDNISEEFRKSVDFPIIVGNPTEPKAEKPAVEEEIELPVEEAEPAQQTSGGCGAGTVLVDGVCQLAPEKPGEGCGAGTVMVNGVCQLDKTTTTSMSIEPLYIIIVVVVIGGVIGAVIAAKRGSKSSGHIQEESVPRKHVKTLETKKTHYLCQNCGTSLKFGARFCGQCGQSVNS